MEADWANLPTNVLQTIFKYIPTSQVKYFPLVCKKWYGEADYYLKDKIWFYAERIENFLDLQESSRHFLNIRITRITNTTLRKTLKILNVLRHRNLTYKSEIQKVYLAFEKFNLLVKVLCALGPIKSLHLINLSDFWKHEHLEDDENLSVLASIETLKIYNFYAFNFKHIIKYFKSLKSLYLNGVIYELDIEGPFTARSSILKGLILENCNIEELYLNSYYEYNTDFEPMDFIKTLPKLRKFKTNIEGMISPVLSNDLDLEHLEIPSGDYQFHENMKLVNKNFPNLKKLYLDGGCFSECLSEGKGLSHIWKLNNLEHLSLQRFNVSNEFFFNSCFRIENSNLTSLYLENFEVDDDFMTMCSKSTPNIQKVKLSLSPYGSFTVFNKMAENWKNLKSLEIDLMLKWFKMSKRHMPAIFENLETLIFNSNIFLLPMNFFQHFRAPRLENITASFAIINCGFEFHSYDHISSISYYSPNVNEISLKMVEDNLNENIVKFLCEKFVNLEKLTIDWAKNLPLELVGMILDSSKNIRNININFFEEIIGEHEEVMEAIEEFSSKRNFKIVPDFENHVLKDGKRLRGDNLEINLGNVKDIKREDNLEGFFDMLDCYDLSYFL